MAHAMCWGREDEIVAIAAAIICHNGLIVLVYDIRMYQVTDVESYFRHLYQIRRRRYIVYKLGEWDLFNALRNKASNIVTETRHVQNSVQFPSNLHKHSSKSWIS